MAAQDNAASSGHLESPNVLDEAHQQALERAVRNILQTELAERTYGQILDGLPTEESINESYSWVEDHPVHTISHTDICPGYVDQARQFRAAFNIADLRFQMTVLHAFNNAEKGSQHFHLRLIELVVVACHQIGAYLFNFDKGAHPHSFYGDWVEKVCRERDSGVESRRFTYPAAIAFAHPFYQNAENYPHGLADVAGYWAEAKLFGGVVIFDRGESEDQCNAMWIEGDLVRGPSTLYPPTEEQFNSLIAFLLAEPDQKAECPLPLRATKFNRPRWDAYQAFTNHHIFRDRYEKVLSPFPPQARDVRNAIDWPELGDRSTLFLQGQINPNGVPYVSDEDVAAAHEGLRNITPSSPLWRSFGNGQ